MSAILSFRQATDIHVTVPPHLSHGAAREIRLAVRYALDHISGVWTVTLQRAQERESWRLELHGPTGRHIWVFLSRPEMLSTVVAGKLKTFIRNAATHYQIRALARVSSVLNVARIRG